MTISGTDLTAAATRVSQGLVPRAPANNVLMAPGSTKAAASATPTSTTSSSAGADITSNDFLTLLVTEMKNQDPTQPTDPNAYIQQLVGVNSLQQLISINQDLSNVTAPTTGTGAGSTGSVAGVASSPSITNF